MAKTIAIMRGCALRKGISRNGRAYTASAIRGMVERAQQRIDAGQEPISVLTHHDAGDDTLRCVGRVSRIWVDPADDSAMFEAELADTTASRDVLALYDTSDGPPIARGVSIRGAWLDSPREIEIDGQRGLGGDHLDLFGVDATGSPGVPGAGVQSVTRTAAESASAESAGQHFITESVEARVQMTETAPEQRADVPHADPGYLRGVGKRFPLDTRAGAFEAWRALADPTVNRDYAARQLKRMRGKTIRALRGHGVTVTPEGHLREARGLSAAAVNEGFGLTAIDSGKLDAGFCVALHVGPLRIEVSSYSLDPHDLDRVARAATTAAADALAAIQDDPDAEPVAEWPMEALAGVGTDEDDDGDQPAESATTAATRAATPTHQEDAAVAETTTETDEIEDGVEEGKQLPPAFLKNIKKKKDAAKDADTPDDDSDDDDSDDEDDDDEDLPAFIKKKAKKTKENTDVTDTVTETSEQRVQRLVEEKVNAVLAEREAERHAAEEAELVERLVAERLAEAEKPAEVVETDEQRIDRLVEEKLAAALEAQKATETEEARIARLVDAGVTAALQDHAARNGVNRTGLTATPGAVTTESADRDLVAAGLPAKPVHQYDQDERRALTAALGQEFLAGVALPAAV